MSTTESLYEQHLQSLSKCYSALFEALKDNHQEIDALLIHSGSEHHYFADDKGIAFEPFGHFCHWLPVNRPDQFLLIVPNEKPQYLQVVPQDFWYDQSISVEDWWSRQYTITTLDSVESLPSLLKDSGHRRIAYIGPEAELAEQLGIERELVNMTAVICYLDYYRAYKTKYEMLQMRSASRQALVGHRAAREAFYEGASEYGIHMAYLRACGVLEEETPYTNIVALNEKSAILHYQHKRKNKTEANNLLLIDAGCRVNGYCSDITRTSISRTVHPLFAELLIGMEKLEQELVQKVQPGRRYQEIHEAALVGIAELLSETTIALGSIESLLENKIPHHFMPHGVGHLLGIQVHDVAGKQVDPQGTVQEAPIDSPFLRNTRIMEEEMVFTIEPGLYFIPVILDQIRTDRAGKQIDWSLVEALTPLGGIRIEDNVRVTAGGSENITRQEEALL